MRRFITLFFIAVVAAIGLSFGGMAFMDHGDDMMAMGTCAIGPCLTSHAGEMRVDCVAHCLKAASNLSSTPTTSTVQFVIFLSAVVLFYLSFFRPSTATFTRSDHGIARLLLHRQLATVMMRE
jgi:hypothetical protein